MTMLNVHQAIDRFGIQLVRQESHRLFRSERPADLRPHLLVEDTRTPGVLLHVDMVDKTKRRLQVHTTELGWRDPEEFELPAES